MIGVQTQMEENGEKILMTLIEENRKILNLAGMLNFDFCRQE